MEMKPRLRTRKQLLNELENAARDPASPGPRVQLAEKLIGDATWAQSDYPTPDVDPQLIADAWFAEESKLTRVNIMLLSTFVINLPRIRRLRPIQIKD